MLQASAWEGRPGLQLESRTCGLPSLSAQANGTMYAFLRESQGGCLQPRGAGSLGAGQRGCHQQR